jgi:hypothetical protein
MTIIILIVLSTLNTVITLTVDPNINLNSCHELVFKMFCYFASFFAQEHPIPFVSKLKKMDKVDGPDLNTIESIKLDLMKRPECLMPTFIFMICPMGDLFNSKCL